MNSHKRKPYVKPAVRKLAPEEAKSVLIEHACRGDQGAKELLEMLFGQQTDAVSSAESTDEVGPKTNGVSS